jgi:mRNA-degrading endonuclease toxin of MazEF toxin-antitoxin module
VVIVSSELACEARASVTVALVWAQARGTRSEVELSARGRLPVSFADACDLQTIPKRWLDTPIGPLSVDEQARIDAALRHALGLERPPVQHSDVAPKNTMAGASRPRELVALDATLPPMGDAADGA